MITPLLTREASLGEKTATNTGSKAKAKAAPLENKFGKASKRMHATDRKNLLQLEKAPFYRARLRPFWLLSFLILLS